LTCSAELDRLVKLLSMLASPHAGERAAAGLKATEFLRSRNMTWSDVIQPKHAGPKSPTELERQLALLRFNVHRLNDWERHFVQSLHRFPRFSERQLATINRIALNLERRAA
jgi:hypothetical protein